LLTQQQNKKKKHQVSHYLLPHVKERIPRLVGLVGHDLFRHISKYLKIENVSCQYEIEWWVGVDEHRAGIDNETGLVQGVVSARWVVVCCLLRLFVVVKEKKPIMTFKPVLGVAAIRSPLVSQTQDHFCTSTFPYILVQLA